MIEVIGVSVLSNVSIILCVSSIFSRISAISPLEYASHEVASLDICHIFINR